MTEGAQVYRHDSLQATLRDAFIAWQCRLRQMAMREAEGRPSAGMCPTLTPAGADEPLGRVVVLLHKADPLEAVPEFRHLAKKTHDPRERREGALKLLQSAYYQRSREFGDRMTALFGPTSAAARTALDAGEVELAFAQYSQHWRLPCQVELLPESAPLFQATYWHNALFNPALPPGVQILAFVPDWNRAEADPPPPGAGL